VSHHRLPKKVVITGGPCAGKTSCLKALVGRFAGRVAVVREASTLLLETGVPKPSVDPKGMAAGQWRMLFQSRLIALQQHLEAEVLHLAQQAGIELVLCDRGLLDGAAYWPEDREHYLRTHGLTLEQAMARYHSVVCLESLAVSQPHLYGRRNDPTLLEGPDLACQVDQRIRAAWQGHPKLVEIASQPVLEGLIDRVSQTVESMFTV